jgi:OOP family OmpA-OmpF porin
MKRTVIVLTLMGALCGSASAADRGFYVGGGPALGSYDMGDFYDDYQDLRFGSKTLGFKLFGGYQILKFLAVEGGYASYGSRLQRESVRMIGTQELSVAIDQWDASIVGILPLGSAVKLVGKVGAASWNTDVQVVEGPDSFDLSSSGTDLTYGLGIEFAVKKFGIRVELDEVDIPDTGDVMLISAILSYRF